MAGDGKTPRNLGPRRAGEVDPEARRGDDGRLWLVSRREFQAQVGFGGEEVAARERPIDAEGCRNEPRTRGKTGGREPAQSGRPPPVGRRAPHLAAGEGPVRAGGPAPPRPPPPVRRAGPRTGRPPG